MKSYKFIKILKELSYDVKEGFVYLCEAFDETGEVVNVKMTENYLKQRGDIPTDESN